MARTAFAVVVLGVLVAVALIGLGRPGDQGGQGSLASPTGTAGAMATTSLEPTTNATAPGATPTTEPTDEPPSRSPSPAATDEPVAFTNPDGPPPDREAPESYPFIELANALPNFASLWFDQNQRDFHIAVTHDIDGAIEALRDSIPRDITVYFHIVQHTQQELCALRDRMFNDREELMRHGIVLMGGGCGNSDNRVNIGMSPGSPEAIAFMEARYPGPVHYEGIGRSALRQYEPVEPETLRMVGVDEDYFANLSTCGGRPFPTAALDSTPVDLQSDGQHFDALREAHGIYSEIYGDLSALPWRLMELDEFGATFVADRGDTLLEAPVYASEDGWVPATIDHCEPGPVSAGIGGISALYRDPAFPEPTSSSTEIHVLVEERECSGGSIPASRLTPPVVRYTSSELHVRVGVRSVEGGATCPGNPMYPVSIVLPEPLGGRRLLLSEPPRY